MAHTAPAPPRGIGTEGRRLWKAILDAYELDEHELALLRQAARVADICADLQAIVDRDGVLLDGKPHPALVELRQQRILLTRIVVSLRVPMGDAEEASARPQYRGTRGAYGIRGSVS